MTTAFLFSYATSMPITKSAKKALRQSFRRRERNIKRRKALKDVVKAFIKAVAQKNMDEAKKLLSLVYKALDKAVKRGVIKQNTASRRKSRLARRISK